MDFGFWFQKALEGIDRTAENTVFLVKELFQGTDWNGLATGDKLKFGSYFKNKVSTGNVPNVRYIGKAQNNSAQYMKIRRGENETTNL